MRLGNKISVKQGLLNVRLRGPRQQQKCPVISLAARTEFLGVPNGLWSSTLENTALDDYMFCCGIFEEHELASQQNSEIFAFWIFRRFDDIGQRRQQAVTGFADKTLLANT